MGVIDPGERWNHNIHYHRLVLDAVSLSTTRAVLDVGCGEGLLCRQLSALGLPAVVGIDSDQASIEVARRQDRDGKIDFRCEEFLTARLPAESFDLVASVASLHHLDAKAALRRMADLLRPGGHLVIIGLARSVFPRDLPRELAAVVVDRTLRLHRKVWTHPSPTVWPPPLSYPELRHLAEEVLPGVRFRRHLLWRYSLAWTKPAASESPPLGGDLPTARDRPCPGGGLGCRQLCPGCGSWPLVEHGDGRPGPAPHGGDPA